MSESVTIVRGGAERIDELEPLWRDLQEYHLRLAPTLGGLPARSAAESWALRRRKYASALQDPDAFVLVAERSGKPVGYALVSLSEGPSGWDCGERVADIETLSVAAAARSQRIGSRLMDAVERELVHLGVRAFRVLVIAANQEALQFYGRRGLIPVSQVLVGRIGDA